MQDTIQREITIKATKEKIYDAIAKAENVVLWFPDTVEGKYEKGEQPVFGFGEYGKSRVYIVDARPYEYFAYRWIPGSNNFLGDVLSTTTTLVEFWIREKGNGECTVTLTESGFAALPPDVVEDAFKQNSEGWEYMLGRLEKHFQTT